MRISIKHIFLLVIIVIASNISSQVKTIKETVRKDKITYTPTGNKSQKNSYGSDYNNTSFGEDMANCIFSGVVKGFTFIIIEAQKAVLNHADDIPNLISLESTLDYGTNLSELTFNPSIRGNWGILASDFRYSLLHDHTGSLSSLDWQVCIVRVPIKNIKLNYGIGFTSLLDPKTTYFESSTGFELNLKDSRLNIVANYRWTSKKLEERYRQEIKCTTDFQIFENGKLHIAPMAGFTYQEYFGRDSFLLVNFGVKIRLF